MAEELWTPPGAKVAPDKAKWDGGSYFDDELEDKSKHQAELKKEYDRMVEHLQQRPDHTVYVGDTKTRTELRAVFNHMYQQNILSYHPNIRIDYGVREGAIRITE